MSTSPYSKDLRSKVIKHLERGNSQKVTAKIFSLSPVTVNKWHRRYKQEGHYLPRQRIGSKANVDEAVFAEYVSKNPNLRSEDIGKEFGITASGARYWLKKLGFSYKKKNTPIWKRKNKSVKNISAK